MTRTRMHIAALGGPWSDTMAWYARAVGELRSRPFDDRTSWVYIGALHGIDRPGWIAQGIVPSTIPWPAPGPLSDRYNQCQHAGWFFLPWHRGYLFALEAILADWIAREGGPEDWALPYWNYLDDTNPDARDIPQEFLDTTMPDGSANPLADALRGPATRLGPQSWIPADITLSAQTSETVYTAIPGTLGYGGPISGYSQFGNGYGANESNPHNLVHVMIGGDNSAAPQGWMYDPNFAALDPIFWLHHCNVDRLWEAWMSDPTHVQEVGAAWRNGPFPTQFTMPDPAGSLWVFVPDETLPGAPLAPTYDSLTSGTGIAPAAASGTIAMVTTTSPPAGGGRAALVGASSAALTVTRSPVHTSIRMTDLSPSALGVAASAAGPATGRLYLNLEGVKGKSPSGVVNVILTAPGADPNAAGPDATRTVALFGLANATSAEGLHGGSGLSATIEITDIVRNLQTANPDALEAHVALPEGGGDSEITIERISIYARRDQ